MKMNIPFRTSGDSNAASMLKAQFLDEVQTRFNGVIFMGATNHPERIDPAFLRRMEGRHLLLLPQEIEKIKLLKITLRGKQFNTCIISFLKIFSFFQNLILTLQTGIDKPYWNICPKVFLGQTLSQCLSIFTK